MEENYDYPNRFAQPTPESLHEMEIRMSENGRHLILEMIEEAEQMFSEMTEEESLAFMEDINNSYVIILDPENYPPDAVRPFEGGYSVLYSVYHEKHREERQRSQNSDILGE